MALSIATVVCSVGAVVAIYTMRGTVNLPPVTAGPGVYVVDGDTVDHDGQRWRLTGYDTPEIYHARCPQERERGIVAAARLAQMIASGARLEAAGERRYKWGRRLGRLVLADGHDAGAALIGEGHARPYDGRTERQGWCE